MLNLDKYFLEFSRKKTEGFKVTMRKLRRRENEEFTTVLEFNEKLNGFGFDILDIPRRQV